MTILFANNHQRNFSVSTKNCARNFPTKYVAARTMLVKLTPYLLHKVDHLADGGNIVIVDGPVGDAAVEMCVVVGSFATQVVNLNLHQNVKS
jgi:hypothetical protein